LRANRNNLPYLIAAGGGLVLVLSLFLTWLSVGDGFSLWKVASGIDIVLALLGLAAAAIAASHVAGTPLPAPPETLKWIGVVTTTIVFTYLIEQDNLGLGVFLGLLASAAILAGAILAGRPDLAGRVADAAGMAADRPAAAPPAGLAPGTTTAAPGPSASAPSTASAPTTSVQPASGAGAAAATPAASPAATAAGVGAASTPAQPAESAGPPAGWYPDPQGQARLRYWDGAAWTDQTSA